MEKELKKEVIGTALGVNEVVLIDIDDNNIFTFIGNERGKPTLIKLELKELKEEKR